MNLYTAVKEARRQVTLYPTGQDSWELSIYNPETDLWDHVTQVPMRRAQFMARQNRYYRALELLGFKRPEVSLFMDTGSWVKATRDEHARLIAPKPTVRVVINDEIETKDGFATLIEACDWLDQHIFPLRFRDYLNLKDNHHTLLDSGKVSVTILWEGGAQSC